VAKLGPVPEAAVTVLCTPDDGCDGHPKHVERDFAVNKLPAYSCILLDLINIHKYNYSITISNNFTSQTFKMCHEIFRITFIFLV
jgi:hypothetical protein